MSRGKMKKVIAGGGGGVVEWVVENPAFLIFRDGRKEYDTEKKAQALSGIGANKDAFSCKTESFLKTCIMIK